MTAVLNSCIVQRALQDLLFDPDGADEDVGPPVQRGWRDVPLDTFLSWDDYQQFAYCAARDEHSAAHTREHEPERKVFFLDRAAWYRRQLAE